MQNLQYKRVLIKLSGEALNGEGTELFDKKAIDNIISQVKGLLDLGVKIGIVIGGGNIFRGVHGNKLGLKQISADYMGILATIMNGIALKDFLKNADINAKVYSAVNIPVFVNPYQNDLMLEDLEESKVVIFVGGTSQPLFTTDSAAALRAVEMEADLLIKATKVDGVYNDDPNKNSNAKKYDKLGFKQVLDEQLKIMDLSAFEMCKANKVDILVCNIFKPNGLVDVVLGKPSGTLVSAKYD